MPELVRTLRPVLLLVSIILLACQDAGPPLPSQYPEATRSDHTDDYFGTTVNVAARIAHKARGGQILVSEVVRELAGSVAEVAFKDAGRRQLKGIPGRQRLYEVVW